MVGDDILNELNELVRNQIDALEKAESRSLTLNETEEYAWRNEQIRLLFEQLEAGAA